MFAGPCRTLRFMAVFYTPRFSYDMPETAVPTNTYTAPTNAYGAVYGLGRYTGWVYRVGNREGIPGTQHAARGEVHVQRSGPRKAHRAWSGWYM